jgi:hypothetical protein
MPTTIETTLEAFASVGEREASVRLNGRIYPVRQVAELAEPHSSHLTADGELLQCRAGGSATVEAVRRLLSQLLEMSLRDTP